MDEPEQREVIDRLNNLAWHVRKGYLLEFHERSPRGRGRKGRSREARRTLMFTVLNAGAFDAFGWDLMKRAMRRRRNRLRTRRPGATQEFARF